MLRKIKIIENMINWLLNSNQDVQESILKYEIGFNNFQMQDFLSGKMLLTKEIKESLYKGTLHYASEVCVKESEIYAFLKNNFEMTKEEIEKEINMEKFKL